MSKWFRASAIALLLAAGLGASALVIGPPHGVQAAATLEAPAASISATVCTMGGPASVSNLTTPTFAGTFLANVVSIDNSASFWIHTATDGYQGTSDFTFDGRPGQSARWAYTFAPGGTIAVLDISTLTNSAGTNANFDMSAITGGDAAFTTGTYDGYVLQAITSSVLTTPISGQESVVASG